MTRAFSDAPMNSVSPRDFLKTQAPEVPTRFREHPRLRFAPSRCMIAITLKTHLGHFYREVDRDVNALLKDGHPPLVVVGVEHEVALFHGLTTYPACVKPGIHGLAGHLGKNEMYQQALELVRSVTIGPALQALGRFDKQIGTGRASSDVQEIVDAAPKGRVEHLFLLENGAVPGEADGGADLLNTAAVQTLRHGGEVQVLPVAGMPAGGPICAVFRYAAAPEIEENHDEDARTYLNAAPPLMVSLSIGAGMAFGGWPRQGCGRECTAASVVQLESEANQSVRSYITGVDGRYHFSEVSYDIDYTLKARYRKFWSRAKSLSQFNSAAHLEIDLIISIE